MPCCGELFFLRISTSWALFMLHVCVCLPCSSALSWFQGSHSPFLIPTNKSPKSQSLFTEKWWQMLSWDLCFSLLGLSRVFFPSHTVLSKAFVMATCPSPEEGCEHIPLRSSLAPNPPSSGLERDAEDSLGAQRALPAWSPELPFWVETSPRGYLAWRADMLEAVAWG